MPDYFSVSNLMAMAINEPANSSEFDDRIRSAKTAYSKLLNNGAKLSEREKQALQDLNTELLKVEANAKAEAEAALAER